MELKRVPDALYVESPEYGVPDVSGVAQFARGPLSPAETGHYNYGPHWPGINTDASGSYRREEVMPTPQKQRSEEHTSELQSHLNLVCRLLLEKKKDIKSTYDSVLQYR